jgi:isoleucyl-tRNA synthetase
LYCEGAKSKTRRAAQTTLHSILEVLVHLMAPILSFTAEEIWQYMPDQDQRPGSVFLSEIPQPDPKFNEPQVADKWDRIFRERSEVLKALELARSAAIIGHSLDAQVFIFATRIFNESMLRSLANGNDKRREDLLIVSQLMYESETPSWLWQLEEARRLGQEGSSTQVHDPDGRVGWAYYSKSLDSIIAVFAARGGKCQRCWKYDVAVVDQISDVCPRCAAVLRAGASA